MSGIISIESGHGICTVAPDIGGSIASWYCDGQPMLRGATSESLANGNVLSSASFPLVPYSNRIGDGRFVWNSRAIVLPGHKLSLPHSIHGVGWERYWSIEALRSDAVSLRLDFGGDENWPWPFLAEQEIEIGDESLLLKLSVTNLADETVPLSFGHHPYFDAKGAMLQFSAKHFYPNAEDDLPADPELPAGPADFSKPRPVLGAKIDNVYDGWEGFARIEWQDRLHALEISTSLSHAVLYTPVDADFFCFEPLPHLTNALNRVDCDVPVVGPGECTATQIDFRTMPKVIKEY